MNSHNAKFAFYYLLSLAALIFVALSVGMIIFGIIDSTIIDALTYNSYNSVDGQLKFAISALLIAAPIYYFLSHLINRGLRKKELEIDSPLRRWLTYFIILVASVTILGVFISVINNFLSGELTGRFILKAATMLLIAAAVFSFYFYDIKRLVIKKKDLVLILFASISGFLVLATFVAAWFFVESPQIARAKRLDQIVSNNIYQLEDAVNNYYAEYKVLPSNLDELKNAKNVYYDPKTLVDPETKQPIEYRVDGEKEFSFCATYRAASGDEAQLNTYYGVGKREHVAGYDCVSGQLWIDESVNTAVPVKR
ncbi:MAG: DUF5671 domain-containing protein [Patescibacteria group bacterium]|nr:DUF5671 domain-containing protein [Patescibacteria group bacterium]